MKKLNVVAAIIQCGEETLCVQRGPAKFDYIAKKYEFPGGKVEQGETNKEALKRELIEELDIVPRIDDLCLTVVHQYPDFEITMHSYFCYVDSKEISLNEHIALEWLSKDNLDKLDWAAADIPIVNKLMK